MRNYADENYLHARIYAMRSRLLTLPDYVSLSGKQDEPLPDKATGDMVAREEKIFQEQIAPLFPLAESTEMYTPLFIAFLRQFEAFNAKLLGAKAFGLMSLEQWYDIGPYAILKRNLLQETMDLQHIRPLLTDTYLAFAFEAADSFEQMESRVDLYAVKNFYAASASFQGPAKRDFQELMGRKIAITSLTLSLRLKKIYQWGDEKIHLFLEHFHEAFGGQVLPQVLIVEQVFSRYLEGRHSGSAEEPSVVDSEHYLEQYYYNWISSQFHRDYHSVFCVVAYLWMLYYQIRNLFKIIEGRRFGFPAERILAGIICAK